MEASIKVSRLFNCGRWPEQRSLSNLLTKSVIATINLSCIEAIYAGVPSIIIAWSVANIGDESSAPAFLKWKGAARCRSGVDKSEMPNLPWFGMGM